MRELKKRTGLLKSDKGFTFIEILVVIAILGTLFAIGLLMSMEAYRGYSRRSDRDILVSALERARSSALANTNQREWGVCYDSTGPSYIIFSGSSYSEAITKTTLPSSPGVALDTSGATAFSCLAGGIIFAQLTGDTSDNSIVLTQGAVISVVSTNQVGRINW